MLHVRRQMRWDIKGRPYFCLPKGHKTRTVPLSPNLARRAKEYLREFPSIECTLPWRNPEAPESALEERQRKPVTVRLVLTTGQGNRINYRTWNERSWKPALAAAGLLTVIGHKEQKHGDRVRRHPVFDLSREDMFHVLRHTYARCSSKQASLSSVSPCGWDTSHRRSRLTTTLTSCRRLAGAAWPPRTSGSPLRPRRRESLRNPWRRGQSPSGL